MGKEWKTQDLIHLFNPFGHVFISWVDDTSAFVSLKDRDWSNQVLNNFKSGDLTYKVQSYDDFIQSKENNAVSSEFRHNPNVGKCSLQSSPKTGFLWRLQEKTS